MSEVLLGVIATTASNGDIDDVRRFLDPYATKCGGVSVKFTGAPGGRGAKQEQVVEFHAVPICGVCGRDLFLVAQVYAPVDGLHRSLSVFGCNRPCCSGQLEAWRVLRSQIPIVEVAAAVPPPPPPPPPPAEEVEEVEAGNGGWGACGDDGGDWGGGFGEEEEEDVDGSIAALLARREQQGVRQQPRVDRNSSHTAAVSTPPVEDATISLPASVTNIFPPHHVDIVAEEFSAGHRADASIVDMLRRYQQFEETEGNGIEDDEVAEAISALVDGRESKQSGENGGGGGGGGGALRRAQSAADERVAEEDGAEEDALLQFEERVRWEPRQVMRYSYGGTPLWSSASPPRASRSVPRCACGADRVFEMQLMPSLLYHLQVDAHAPSAPNPTGEGASDADATAPLDNGNEKRGDDVGDNGNNDDGSDDGADANVTVAPVNAEAARQTAARIAAARGMDWGVVGVWSCPDSCDQSQEEIAVVQSAN